MRNLSSILPSSRSILAILIGLVFSPAPASALYRDVVIDEIVASYDGDPGKQYVEMRMLSAGQNGVAHSVFALFDETGAYASDLVVVAANVSLSGTDVRWLVATPDFQDEMGLTADFTMPQGQLPAAGGMICFGGGTGVTPQNPPNWSRTDFANYVDCLAYGTYAGPSNPWIGTPSPRAPLDHALQRIGISNDNDSDFACSDSLTPTNNAGGTLALAATIPCACGNGLVQGDEDCDDGNQATGDCCSQGCDYEAYGSACAADAEECRDDICNGAATCIHPPSAFGTPCTADAEECTGDVCDGSGACSHPASPPDTPCTADTNECSGDLCDGAGACGHPPLALGTPCTADANLCTDDQCDGAGACDHPNNTAPCDDGDLCTPVDTCSDGACLGDEAPRTGCLQPIVSGQSSLLLKDQSDDGRDLLTWKWKKGDATDPLDLGDPGTGTDYALCIYDGSGPGASARLRLGALAPNGGTCGSLPCWKQTSSGWKYGDSLLTPDGLRSMSLKAGAAGRAQIIAKGKGTSLAVPSLPLATPVTAQIVNSLGVCWEAHFSAARPVADPTRLFKATSD